MVRFGWLLLLAIPAAVAEDQAVFRSDVSLVRVDAQVVDRDNRAITGLQAEDFILREGGKPQQIRNFDRENMPIDVLLLFDVSASMRPHVERIASAAHQAMQVLGEHDRVGIMVFDRSSRLRLSLRSNRQEVERELEAMLRHETFRGGTDITRGLLDAASYIAREGRHDARRAIVILTDDQTEKERDEERVSNALARADAVLSLLLAPDAMAYRHYPGGGGQGRHGGSGGGGPWGGNGGGGGGGLGGPLGGIILGRRGGYGGRQPGVGSVGGGTHSAGTAEIARQSGGDSMSVDDASALETTLERLRQRYALHFHLPEGTAPGQERNIEVELSAAARRRYPDAEIRFRRSYHAPGGAADPGGVSYGPTVVTRVPATTGRSSEPAHGSETSTQAPVTRRRMPVDEPAAPRGPIPTP